MLIFSDKIPDWIPAYTADTSEMVLPIASFAEITDPAQVNTSGDNFRGWLLAILTQLHDVFHTLPRTELPANMVITKQLFLGTLPGEETVRFTVQFTTLVAPGGRTVKPE